MPTPLQILLRAMRRRKAAQSTDGAQPQEDERSRQLDRLAGQIEGRCENLKVSSDDANTAYDAGDVEALEKIARLLDRIEGAVMKAEEFRGSQATDWSYKIRRRNFQRSWDESHVVNLEQRINEAVRDHLEKSRT